MTLNDAFPSKFLKAADLPEEGSLVVTIEKIALEEIGRDKQSKPVLYFEECAAMILNKTNGRVIARLFNSEDFDDWIGQKIKLYRTETDFQGDIVECIRVRSKPDKALVASKTASPKSVPITQRKAGVPEDREVDDDGIPF